MSKEEQARDVALREYNNFMEKYKDGVESGDPRLMQHMLKLEANKIRTQDILNAVEKSKPSLQDSLYDFEKDKMKIQMNSQEYRRDQAREEAFIKMATKDTTKEEKKEQPKQPPISIGDPDKQLYHINAMDFGQITNTPAKKDNKDTKKEVKQKNNNQPKSKPIVSIDPKTGKKIYNGPKLRSRKVVKGKNWDSSHPDYHG